MDAVEYMMLGMEFKTILLARMLLTNGMLLWIKATSAVNLVYIRRQILKNILGSAPDMTHSVTSRSVDGVRIKTRATKTAQHAREIERH